MQSLLTALAWRSLNARSKLEDVEQMFIDSRLDKDERILGKALLHLIQGTPAEARVLVREQITNQSIYTPWLELIDTLCALDLNDKEGINVSPNRTSEKDTVRSWELLEAVIRISLQKPEAVDSLCMLIQKMLIDPATNYILPLSGILAFLGTEGIHSNKDQVATSLTKFKPGILQTDAEAPLMYLRTSFLAGVCGHAISVIDSDPKMRVSLAEELDKIYSHAAFLAIDEGDYETARKKLERTQVKA